MKKIINPRVRKAQKRSLVAAPLSAALILASSTAWSAPGLIDVYQMAVLHDAKLAQARATYQANQEALNIARSPLLPQIAANANYVKNDSNVDTADVTTRELGLSMTQSLYQHDNWARYSQAKYQMQKSEYEIKFAEQDLIVRVSDAYFKVLLAQEDVKLAQAKEEADQTQWERAQASAEVGLASKTDVLQAKSSYDLSKSQRITAENNLDVAYEELMKLTGKPVSEFKVIKLNVNLPAQNLDMSKWENMAEEQNLDVLQVEETTNVASKEVEVQKSGHWFNLDLKAQYTDQSYSDFNAIYPGQYSDRNNLMVGVYATLPLYSGGGVSAKVSEARANYKAATLGLRDAKESARLNARIQVRNVERGMELVMANRAAVQSNDAFLEAAEEGYKVGLKNLLEVLTARTNMFQARRNLAESLHNVVLSRLKLEAIVGRLTADKLVQFDTVLSNPTHEKMPKLDKPSS